MLDPSSYYHMNQTRALTLAHITCYVVDTSAALGAMKGGSVAIVVHRQKQPHQPGIADNGKERGRLDCRTPRNGS